MKVFVTGASGYIGSAVSAALARAGHDVNGLVRAHERGKRLAAAEVEPVVGSMGDPASYAAVARSCQVLIHCAAEYSAAGTELDLRTIEALLESASGTGSPRLVIYTSGVWVHGDTGGEMVDEATPPKPAKLVAHRPAHETMVLAGNRGPVRTLVIRPGCVYGGRGGMTGAWFETAVNDGASKIVGDGSFRWAMVHVEDLADAFVRAAESSCGGEIFNVTDRSRFTVLECAEAASRAAGAGGKVHPVPFEEAAKKMGPFAEALVLDQHIDSRKAVRMLGWQPRHGGFVDGAPRYFAAWKAAS